MKVLVLGAGVIGVTTAYTLAKSGHQVTVVERLDAAASGTSYANAGQISPALSAPWNAPGLIGKALKWMRQSYPPLIVSSMPNLEMLSWLWRFYRAANPASYDQAKRAMVALGEYSRERLHQLLADEDIDFSGRRGGTFVLFRDAHQVAAYERDLAALAELNVDARRLTLDELAALEPNLATAKLTGAVLLPGDETGDCRAFTRALAERAKALGVNFLWRTEVRRIVVEGGRAKAVEVGNDTIEADTVIVAMGVYSKALVAPLGIELPIYPVKGYSLTIDADSDMLGPTSTVSDETYKVGVTSFGDRIRVGGTAEIAGYSLTQPKHRFEGLRFVAGDLFPKLPRQSIANAVEWSGLRPMTVDGPPIVGRTKVDNLFINAGHGTLGWTMAVGSAGLVSAMVEGRPLPIEPAGYAVGR